MTKIIQVAKITSYICGDMEVVFNVTYSGERIRTLQYKVAPMTVHDFMENATDVSECKTDYTNFVYYK